MGVDKMAGTESLSPALWRQSEKGDPESRKQRAEKSNDKRQSRLGEGQGSPYVAVTQSRTFAKIHRTTHRKGLNLLYDNVKKSIKCRKARSLGSSPPTEETSSALG